MGSEVIDTGVGLVFVYLMVSLIVTAANELLASCSRARARDLERGIRKLLDGSTVRPERWWTLLIRRIRGGQSTPRDQWSDAFFNHHLISALSKDGQCPSYIPAKTFVAVLNHLICSPFATASTPSVATIQMFSASTLNGFSTFDDIANLVTRINNPRLRTALMPLVEAARADMTRGIAATDKFGAHVEVWFDSAMDRVSGWYKRRTQWFLFGIALIAACTLNVDTVAIVHQLGRSGALRASVVEGAKATTAHPATQHRQPTTQPDLEAQAVDKANTIRGEISQMKQLGIPIGWGSREESDLSAVDAERLRAAKEAVVESELSVASAEQEVAAQKLKAQFAEDGSQGRKELVAATSKAGAATEALDAAKASLATLQRVMYNGGSPTDSGFTVLWQEGNVAILTKIFGLLLTACAASLGAPFWFDVLNKFMSVRSAGKAPEEKPKDPKAVLQPQGPTIN